jgi:acyl dehydratase
MNQVASSVILFVLAGLVEIGGGYLVRLWWGHHYSRLTAPAVDDSIHRDDAIQITASIGTMSSNPRSDGDSTGTGGAGFPVITPEALAELRKRVGVPVRRPQPYIEVATRDAVRHWAAGIGDRNPFWLIAGVAPPTILFAMDRIVSGYVSGLPGVHAMYAGTDFRWDHPIQIGDRIHGDSVLLDLVEKPSRFAKRAIQQIYRTTFRDQRDEVVCVADSWCFRTERDAAREGGKYEAAAGPARYTPAEVEAIARAYRAEVIRGGSPRFVQEVEVGETLPEVVKGPLTVTSVIAFIQGWGSLYVGAHGLAFELFERHPALGIPNAFGVPEPPERVHWDEALARAVGVPRPYDYGPERVAWLGHLVTNWMGDAGFLRRLNVQVLRHNLIGDTTWCRGRVTGKREDGVVDLALRAENQRGETTAAGTAEVVLPRNA